ADTPPAHPQPHKAFHPPPCDGRSYPVLDSVSTAYPGVRGRSLTCYSPVRRSCTPEGALPLDLHVLSTPPAFVLSQDQTLHKGPNTHPQGRVHLENNPDQPPTRGGQSKKPYTRQPTPPKGKATV